MQIKAVLITLRVKIKNLSLATDIFQLLSVTQDVKHNKAIETAILYSHSFVDQYACTYCLSDPVISTVSTSGWIAKSCTKGNRLYNWVM